MQFSPSANRGLAPFEGPLIGAFQESALPVDAFALRQPDPQAVRAETRIAVRHVVDTGHSRAVPFVAPAPDDARPEVPAPGNLDFVEYFDPKRASERIGRDGHPACPVRSFLFRV